MNQKRMFQIINCDPVADEVTKEYAFMGVS